MTKKEQKKKELEALRRYERELLSKLKKKNETNPGRISFR
jgi:hypothetical protein